MVATRRYIVEVAVIDFLHFKDTNQLLQNSDNPMIFFTL